MDEESLPLRERLNLETARIHWRELERLVLQAAKSFR
jgi:hypothetical protein